MAVVPLLTAIVVLLALSAVFSMTEAAYLAVNKVRLRLKIGIDTKQARVNKTH